MKSHKKRQFTLLNRSSIAKPINQPWLNGKRLMTLKNIIGRKAAKLVTLEYLWIIILEIRWYSNQPNLIRILYFVNTIIKFSCNSLIKKFSCNSNQPNPTSNEVESDCQGWPKAQAAQARDWGLKKIK